MQASLRAGMAADAANKNGALTESARRLLKAL
jgi:hypothetical protein